MTQDKSTLAAFAKGWLPVFIPALVFLAVVLVITVRDSGSSTDPDDSGTGDQTGETVTRDDAYCDDLTAIMNSDLPASQRDEAMSLYATQC